MDTQIGQTISAQDFNKQYGVGSTISGSNFDKLYGETPTLEPISTNTPYWQTVDNTNQSFIDKALNTGDKLATGAVNAFVPLTKSVVDAAVAQWGIDPKQETQIKDYVALHNNLLSQYKTTTDPSVKETLRQQLSNLVNTPYTPLMQKVMPTVYAETQGQTMERVAGEGLSTAATVGSLGMKAPTNVGKAALQGAKIGAIYGTGQGMQEKKSVGGVVGSGIKGAAIGAPLGAVTYGVGKLVEKGLPHLLSWTSGKPQNLVDQVIENPKSVKVFGKQPTIEGVTSDVQGAVRGLRTNLSKEWGEGMQAVVDEFPGVRVGLNDQEQKLVQNVMTQFPSKFKDIPANIDFYNMSAKESADLLASVNKIIGNSNVMATPTGVNAGEVVDIVKDKMINAFGGKGGSLDTLYSNYSAKKTILDAADDIVKAYQTNTAGGLVKDAPALTSARNTLNNIFNENKGAYIDVIHQLEQATGKDFMTELAQTQFTKIMPDTKITSLWQAILSSLRTPKAMGIELKVLSSLAKVATNPTTQKALRTLILGAILQPNKNNQSSQ